MKNLFSIILVLLLLCPMGIAQEETTEQTPVIVTKEQAEQVEEGVEVEEAAEELGEETRRREVVQPLSIYGSNLFRLPPGRFIPADVPPSDDYLLGPGDEIIINASGRVAFRATHTVDQSGVIHVSEVEGNVKFLVYGKTLGQFKQEFNRVAKSKYSESEFDVSLGRLRLIKVSVTGEVARPGDYQVANLSRILDLLYVAGGPTSLGTYRDIQLIRKGKPFTSFDIYEFLGGDATGNVLLMSEDIIHVRIRGHHVAVNGEITRPAIYEMKGGEFLRDVINLSGGFRPTADSTRVKMAAIDSINKRVVRDVDLTKGDNPEITDHIIDVTFNPISDRITNWVDITGMVWAPGRYELKLGMRVADLVRKAVLYKNAYMQLVHIERYGEEDSLLTIVDVNLEKALEGDPQHNLLLQWRDTIRIFSVWDFFQRYYIWASGEFRNPRSVLLTEDMTLSQFVAICGGFTDICSETLYVSRRREATSWSDTTRYLIKIPFPRDIEARADTFKLLPYDYVSAGRNPFWKDEYATIVGEIRNPARYPLETGKEKISDVIKKAGGLTPFAFKKGAVLTRTNEELGIGDISRMYRGIPDTLRKTIAEFSNRIVINNPEHLDDPKSGPNITLRNGDVLYIPKSPEVVYAFGKVLYPGSIAYEPRRTARDYITDAGGFAPDADKGRVRIIRADGRLEKIKPLPLLPFFYRELWEGDGVIVFPEEPSKPFDSLQFAKDATQILANAAVTIAVINRIR